MRKPIRAGMRVWRLRDPEPNGATEATWGDAEVLVKRNMLHQNVVVNEFICNRLAAALGLRVPSGDLWIELVHGDPVLRWAIAVIKESEVSLPPTLQSRLTSVPESDRALIYMFDELIYNIDRQEDNMIVDSQGNYWLIDHDQALFGGIWAEDRASALLSTVSRKLPNSGHFWTPETLPSIAHLSAARDRIRMAPRAVFAAGANELFERRAISATDRDAIVKFLLERRDALTVTPSLNTSYIAQGALDLFIGTGDA